MAGSLEGIRYRQLMLLSLPAIVAVALEPMAEIIDTAVLGQVDSHWVAALAVTNSFLSSFAWVFNFLSYGVTAQIAQRFGQGKKAQVGPAIISALVLALALGGGVCLLLMGGKEFFLYRVMAISPELAKAALPYWDIRVLGYPFALLALALIGILRGLQQISLSMYMVALITGVNAFGSVVSVLVWNAGIEGAAYATTFSFIIGDAFVLSWLWRKRADYGLWGRFKWSAQELISLGKDGLNLFGRTACLTAAFFVMTALASRLGANALASHQIALQLWLLVSFFIDGFAVTATSLGGKLIGEGNIGVYRSMGKRLLNLAFFTGLGFLLVYWGGEKQLIGFFTDDHAIENQLHNLWYLLVFSQPFYSLLYVYDGLLFGAKEFAYLRARMIEGLLFAFLLPLLCFYSSSPSLLSLWSALLCLNAYRLLSGAYRFHTAEDNDLKYANSM